MNSIFNWNGGLNLPVPRALRSSHDEGGAELARAMIKGGPITKAATRVAELCYPAFRARGEKRISRTCIVAVSGGTRSAIENDGSHAAYFRFRRERCWRFRDWAAG